MKKVLIVESQTAIRELLAHLLTNELLYEVVAETGDGQEACDLALKLAPDLIILDIILPGLNGAEIARRVIKQLKGTRILAFSGHQNISNIKELLQAGTHGFVEKTASLTELKLGIETVIKGGTYFGPETAKLVRDAVIQGNNHENISHGLQALTAREKEVLKLIAESYTTKDIASKLDISVKTAENHRTNLMRKLNMHNIAGLTRFAIQNGLIDYSFV